MPRPHSSPADRFVDRHDAGIRLAQVLGPYLHGIPRDQVLLLGLARGGVAVAAEVGFTLGVPFDALVVRKIGSPFQPELAIGAVAPEGVRVYNRDLIAELGLSRESVARLTKEIDRDRDALEAEILQGRPRPDMNGKTVVLVDDGLATGASMRAALEYARNLAAQVIIAVPVASPDVMAAFEDLGVEVVAPLAVRDLGSVGKWYDRFDEVTTGQARRLLEPPPDEL